MSNFSAIIDVIVGIITNNINPLLIALATVYFLWGVLSYIMSAGDEKKLTEARHYITYGLIGLFAIIAMWGLVSIIAQTFISGGGGMPEGPTNI